MRIPGSGGPPRFSRLRTTNPGSRACLSGKPRPRALAPSLLRAAGQQPVAGYWTPSGAGTAVRVRPEYGRHRGPQRPRRRLPPGFGRRREAQRPRRRPPLACGRRRGVRRPGRRLPRGSGRRRGVRRRRRRLPPGCGRHRGVRRPRPRLPPECGRRRGPLHLGLRRGQREYGPHPGVLRRDLLRLDLPRRRGATLLLQVQARQATRRRLPRPLPHPPRLRRPRAAVGGRHRSYPDDDLMPASP